MHDSFATIVGFLVAALLLVMFPLWATADQENKITQDVLETEVREFVTKAIKEYEVSDSNYYTFKGTLPSLNNYVIELEVWRLDENTQKKASVTNSKKVGENGYVGYFNAEILEQVDNTGSFKLEKGDIFKMSVYNTNQTIDQQTSGLPNADIITNSASYTATVY